MRAQNLTISVPYKGCDKNCAYCVSKMTGYVDESPLFYSNMGTVQEIARISQVTSVLITGKGEPFLNFEACKMIGLTFPHYPIEIQTNGVKLMEKFTSLSEDSFRSNFIESNLNVLAISVDRMSDWKHMMPMLDKIREFGYVVRITINVTDELDELPNICFEKILEMAKISRVHQISFRNIIAPQKRVSTVESVDAEAWIKEHRCEELYEDVVNQFQGREKTLVRSLPFGAKVYDCEGVSVVAFDYCVQESNNGDDIRSLIYQEDGHLYTSWDSPASILF